MSKEVLARKEELAAKIAKLVQQRKALIALELHEKSKRVLSLDLRLKGLKRELDFLNK